MPSLISPFYTREHSPTTKQGFHGRTDSTLAQQVLSDWKRIQELRNGASCVIDGSSLGIADVVAVAKYGLQASLSVDSTIPKQIEDSIEILERHLRDGHTVYGVTTGYGGSADTRTTDLESLQRSLVQHQNTGVLTGKDIGQLHWAQDAFLSAPKYDDFDANFDTQSQPTAWVRASMLTRCNSIIRGHSAVRLVVAETMLALLRHEITPIVPLRGSISASGDLSPLSYIAGAIEGSPDIYVRCGKNTDNIMTAKQALAEFGIEPITLRAKEGLGLLNGTAFSAATGALALHQVFELTTLSQVLTAMSTEALMGTAESFYPKIADMRPHPGQIESAASILKFLTNSKLAQCVNNPKDTKTAGLYQDRYAIRTSSQWIGPQIEDLLHAQAQLKRELNSTTDNPLIDTENDRVLHGGNFQAAVVTSTMDRTRLCIEKLGRMLFAQATEIINPSLNKGLPANLASDDPSLSFTCKGVDINMASYASELGFLANPVGNHVMSAEMHNQAINSLALISSRYTFQAIDVIRIMSAAHMFVVCQALDLRVLQIEFLKAVEHKIQCMIRDDFTAQFEDRCELMQIDIWNYIACTWPTTTALDLVERCSKTADGIVGNMVQWFVEEGSGIHDISKITKFVSKVKTTLEETYNATRSRMYDNHLIITPTYLGNASKRIYTFVRSDLGLQFHRGLIEHPTQPAPLSMSEQEAAQRKTIGSQISIIYEALKDCRMSEQLMHIVEASL